MRVSIDFMGEPFVAEVDYRITYHGCPASGPSFHSGGEPAEPPEWEVESIVLMLDRPEGLGAEFEATGKLLEHLCNLDAICDKIVCEIVEGDW